MKMGFCASGLGAVLAAVTFGCSGGAGGATGESTSDGDQAMTNPLRDQWVLGQLARRPIDLLGPGAHTAPSVCSPRAGAARCHARIVADANGNVIPFSSPSGLTPPNLVSAYAIPSLSASAPVPTIAIVDALDDPNAESDLQAYRSQFGMPTCTTANGCFKKVDQRGGTTYPAGDTGWAGEISLDLDMASAGCPACKILLVEADSAALTDLGAAVNEAVTLGASVVSNSYGGAESSSNASFDTLYFDHPGVSLFASAGDNAYSSGVQYPASGRYVIGVGGTSLVASATSRGWTETVWGTSATSGTGSGCSSFTTKPSWQSDKTCTKKMVSDVSAVADPATYVAVYDTYGQSGWTGFGGTSASAPLVAAIFAASNLSGAQADFVWANATYFYDVVSGNNGSCSGTYYCTAGAGYDGPTGWGSPNAALFGLAE